MPTTSQQIVQKLWRYCNILRDDGLSYPDYVEQLTYLLFLKMAYEQKGEDGHPDIVPEAFNWGSLVSKPDNRQLQDHYSNVLRELGNGPGMLGVIFKGAESKIRDPAKLALLVNDLIEKENWSALDADVKGDAYEGLLEKNAQDTKSGAGQYFTPRPVIQAIIDVIQPKPSDTICDPACGSCGFLLAAVSYIRETNHRLTKKQKELLRLRAIRGDELVPAVARLGAMNLLLHGIGPSADEAPPPITITDSLAVDRGDRYDVVVTNPPFGKKSSVTILRDLEENHIRDLTIFREDFWTSTSNKQLNFLQHVNTILKSNGRAAIVVPDNVLFEAGAGEKIRRRLLYECEVHTLLRLPTGIFYAGGVKANVLFFNKPKRKGGPHTKKLWIYDLRTNFHVTLKSNPIQRPDLDEFVKCFKPGEYGRRRATWSSKNQSGRWRSFDYEELTSQGECRLDIAWLQEEIEGGESVLDPATLASEIVDDLQAALVQFEAIAEDLER